MVDVVVVEDAVEVVDFVLEDDGGVAFEAFFVLIAFQVLVAEGDARIARHIARDVLVDGQAAFAAR